MPTTIQSIGERYSCRSFTGQPLRSEDVQALGKAALASPSAINLQPWRILAVVDKTLIDATDQKVMEALKSQEDLGAYERIQSRGGKVFYNAPCIFYIFKEDTPHSTLDCGIVAQNIALAAHDLGLASVICGMAGVAVPDFEGILPRFPSGGTFLPKGFGFATSVLVGYPKETRPPHDLDMSKFMVFGDIE